MIQKPKIDGLTVGLLFSTIKTMRFPFKLFFFLSIVIVLPSLFILLNAFEDRQDIRSRATGMEGMPQSQKIIFLEFDFEEDEQGEKMLKFSKPEVRNGYVVNEVLGSRTIFTATVLNSNQLPIAVKRFSLPDFVAIDGLDVISGQEHGEMREVKGDEYAIALPYSDTARFVKIENIRGEIINLLSLEDLPEINNLVAPLGKRGDEHEKEAEEKEMMRKEKEEDKEEKKEEKKKEKEQDKRHLLDFLFNKIYAASGTFNIAIIGDNYAGDNIRFQSDVNDLARGLVSIEPFASNKDKIVFYSQLSNISICQPREAEWPSMSCNDSLALQEASTIPYDKVYVLYNGNYTGYAYIGGVLSYGTNSLDQNLAVKQGLFIHEMAGHSLGALMDEYSYGISGYSYAPNCSESNSCPSWSAISGLGCFSTCGYTNLYKATDNNSVMNTSYFRGGLGFDAFSTQIVLGKLSEYLKILDPTLTPSPILDTPTPTLTPVATLTLTPNLTPTLTPVPSMTPSVTMAPSITSVPTVTQQPSLYDENIPTPTSTPTSTPIPTHTPTPTFTPTPTMAPSLTPLPTVVICSVPNYCTAVKYCSTDLQTEGSCLGEGRVCCRPQTEYKEEQNQTTLNTQGNLPLPTPTSIQRFEPLPTVPLPTPTIERFASPTPTSSVVPTPTQIPSPTTYYLTKQNLQPTPTRVIPTQVQTTSVPPTVPPTQEVFPSLTQTPTSVPELVFERITPTLVPEPSTLSFIAALFKTLMSILFGQ